MFNCFNWHINMLSSLLARSTCCNCFGHIKKREKAFTAVCWVFITYKKEQKQDGGKKTFVKMLMKLQLAIYLL